MARIAPPRLVVVRHTEHALMPERGVTVGNSGLTEVSPNGTWIIAAECMMPGQPEKYWRENGVFVVKVR